MVISPGVHSTQKVHAPFECVLNRTLNAGVFNPKRVVTFTPFSLFAYQFSLEWDDLPIWSAQKGNNSEKRQFRGNFEEVIGKRTLNAGTRGFLDLKY